MDATASLHPAVQRYFVSVKDRDASALTKAFTENAEVLDVSRHIKGRANIKKWASNEVIGGIYEILNIESPNEKSQHVLLHFTPLGAASGFKALYSFELLDGKIVFANLQYA